MTNSELIIQKLEKALYLTSNVLSQSVIEDLSIDIHAKEWGLAFEIMCERLYEDELPISYEAYELLKEIGLIIKAEKDYWEDLKPQIIPGS